MLFASTRRFPLRKPRPDLQLAHSLSCRYWLYTSQNTRPTSSERIRCRRPLRRTRACAKKEHNGDQVTVDAFFSSCSCANAARWTPAIGIRSLCRIIVGVCDTFLLWRCGALQCHTQDRRASTSVEIRPGTSFRISRGQYSPPTSVASTTCLLRARSLLCCCFARGRQHRQSTRYLFIQVACVGE